MDIVASRLQSSYVEIRIRPTQLTQIIHHHRMSSQVINRVQQIKNLKPVDQEIHSNEKTSFFSTT